MTGCVDLYVTREPGVTPSAIPDGTGYLSEYGYYDKKGDTFYFHDGTTRVFPAGESLHPSADTRPEKDRVRWSEWTDEDRARRIRKLAERRRKQEAEYEARLRESECKEKKRQAIVARAKRKLTPAEFQAVLTEGADQGYYD